MEEKNNKEEALIAVNIESRISEKGSRNHPLTAEQKASNNRNSASRSKNRNNESGLQYNPYGDPSGILLGILLGQLIKRDRIVTATT